MNYIKKILLLVLLSFISLQSEAVINGKRANPENFLFHANIHVGDELDHTCGATILNDKFLLTAAHCTDHFDPDEIKILINVFEDRKIKTNEYKEVKKIYTHKDYQTRDNFNGLLVGLGLVDKQKELVLSDLSIIELLHPIKDNVNSVNLVKYNTRMDIYTTGKGAIESSEQFSLEKQYGSQKNIEHILYNDRAKPILRVAQLSHSEKNLFCENEKVICTQNYNNKTKIYTGTGSGDSGGALLSYNSTNQTYEQIGITSFSRRSYNTDKSYSAFTSIDKHLDFINEFANKSKKLTYDPEKGHNNFIALGDGLTEKESTVKFANAKIMDYRINVLILSFFLIIIVGLLFFALFLQAKTAYKKNEKITCSSL